MQVRGWLWRSLPFVFYLLMAALLTMPLVFHLGSRLGGMGDAGQYLWNVSRLSWDVFHLHNPLYSHWVFAPGGANMAWNAQDTLVGVALAPLAWAVGPVVAYNAALLLLLAADATSMYVLAGDLVKSRSARYLAGALYGFSPYLLAHADMGHMNLVSVFWLPLLVRVLLRLERGTVDPARGALSLAVIGAGLVWTDLELTVFAALLALFLLGRKLVRLAKPLAGGALGAALLSLPFWAAFLPAAHGMPGTSSIRVDEHYAADLLNYLVPGPFEVWGAHGAIRGFLFRIGFPSEETEFLGLAVLAILPWVLRFAWRRQELRPFLRLLALSILLSLGPYLRVAGFQTAIPTPYLFLVPLPGLSLLREGARFGLLVTLALAVLVGMWWDGQVAKRPLQWRRRGLLLLAGVQYLSILPALWPLSSIRVPLALQAVARQETGRNILVLPFVFAAGNVLFMMPGGQGYRYQGLQTLPTGPLPYRLVDGYVSKLPPAFVARQEGNVFLRDLQALSLGYRGRISLPAMRQALGVLSRQDQLAAIVLLPPRRPAKWVRVAEEVLAGLPCRVFVDGSRLCLRVAQAQSRERG